MVIRTSATSAKAAEGQEATLEFILVNHPLDCPVCDKGGECPLQDLTFRYGPGQHADVVREADVRQADPRLAAHRARPRALHPLLPLHAFLARTSPRTASSSRATAARGRRSRRSRTSRTAHPSPGTSSSSARWARSPRRSIASMRGRGTSRTSRRSAPDAPVGCNTSATIREGKVKRIHSRNHPEIDRGWLCDKGRFSYPHLRAETALRRLCVVAGRGSRRSPGTTRSTRPRRCYAKRTVRS